MQRELALNKCRQMLSEYEAQHLINATLGMDAAAAAADTDESQSQHQESESRVPRFETGYHFVTMTFKDGVRAGGVRAITFCPSSFAYTRVHTQTHA